MSKRDHTTIINTSEDIGPTTLISAAKLHEAKIRGEMAPLPVELGIDPLYAPLLEAAELIRKKLELKYKDKIEAVKRETAEQTHSLYNRLTEAREEFKRLEQQFKDQSEESKILVQRNSVLEQDLRSAVETTTLYQQKVDEQQSIIHQNEFDKATRIRAAEEQNTALIERLKDKIQQITTDYTQQLDNLQQKLNYEQNRLSDEISSLSEVNDKLVFELKQMRHEQHVWQQGTVLFDDKIKQLESNNALSQQNLKEKAEKLLRAEHALKLANEELGRSQNYVKELEEKNNTLQKELLENWIRG